MSKEHNFKSATHVDLLPNSQLIKHVILSKCEESHNFILFTECTRDSGVGFSGKIRRNR